MKKKLFSTYWCIFFVFFSADSLLEKKHKIIEVLAFCYKGSGRDIFLTVWCKSDRLLNKKALSLKQKAVTSEQKDSISTGKNWKPGENVYTYTGSRLNRSSENSHLSFSAGEHFYRLVSHIAHDQTL